MAAENRARPAGTAERGGQASRLRMAQGAGGGPASQEEPAAQQHGAASRHLPSWDGHGGEATGGGRDAGRARPPWEPGQRAEGRNKAASSGLGFPVRRGAAPAHSGSCDRQRGQTGRRLWCQGVGGGCPRGLRCWGPEAGVRTGTAPGMPYCAWGDPRAPPPPPCSPSCCPSSLSETRVGLGTPCSPTLGPRARGGRLSSVQRNWGAT